MRSKGRVKQHHIEIYAFWIKQFHHNTRWKFQKLHHCNHTFIYFFPSPWGCIMTKHLKPKKKSVEKCERVYNFKKGEGFVSRILIKTTLSLLQARMESVNLLIWKPAHSLEKKNSLCERIFRGDSSISYLKVQCIEVKSRAEVMEMECKICKYVKIVLWNLQKEKNQKSNTKDLYFPPVGEICLG